jgi:hypothetical protein
MLLRYYAEKDLPALSNDDLYSFVKSYDEHFTYKGIPTERIRDVYLEAMAQHGKYLLKVDDYLRAWDRIKPEERRGVDMRPMGERGTECAICQGTGRTVVFIPSEDKDIEKECPYHCRVITALERTTALSPVEATHQQKDQCQVQHLS